MNENAFRQQLYDHGYDEVIIKDYPPHADGTMHSHDFSVMLLVLDGEFTLARADGATTYRPGDVCELSAGIGHVEQTGAEGARVLLGKRS